MELTLAPDGDDIGWHRMNELLLNGVDTEWRWHW